MLIGLELGPIFLTDLGSGPFARQVWAWIYLLGGLGLEPICLRRLGSIHYKKMEYPAVMVAFFVLNLFMFGMAILQLCYGSLCSFEGFVGCEDILKHGVTQFLEFAKFHVDAYGRLRCPCKRCLNLNWSSLEGVERHLLTIGISPYYTEWDISEDEICDQVLGRRPGYSKGLGWGPKPKARRTASASSSSISCSQYTQKEIELQAKLHEALERIEVQDRNHQALASQVEAMKKMIEDLTRAQQGPPHDP
ncbi:uncharacterized protein E6C27_scaffold404G001210 [Cucumis melo var. makuwa]|uniref:Transposase-associated domain-containing protein n=2 Tax=Cucumis melo TaxID=3656 RepID=A0A5A7U4T2_CUCMM|nr:uncharacterized protein E6C27_scaffold404G001210 [Cucumis melo var. makuwa]